MVMVGSFHGSDVLMEAFSEYITGVPSELGGDLFEIRLRLGISSEAYGCILVNGSHSVVSPLFRAPRPRRTTQRVPHYSIRGENDSSVLGGANER